MRFIAQLAGVGGLAFAATAVIAGTASASTAAEDTNAVFVQTDNPAGNTIVAYDRAADGSLRPAGTYPTGGLGGVLTGSVVDHLASQGSLALDRDNGLLYAVNAGSDTITVFGVHGDRLARRQVISSGGAFPVSIAVHGNLVYVLNARDGGSVQGYLRIAGTLIRIPTWHRSLGLDPSRDARSSPTPPARSPSPRTAEAGRHHQGRQQRHRRVLRRHSAACRPSRSSPACPARCRSRSPSTPAATWSSPRPAPTRWRTFTVNRDGTLTQLDPSAHRPGRHLLDRWHRQQRSTCPTPAAPAFPATT